MELAIKRSVFTSLSTVGELWIDTQWECYTLEDCVREILGQPVESWKIAGQTAIPTGRFRVTIDKSTRFNRLMPHILNVPGFTGVRIHWGNDAKDTEGCPLVGQEKTTDFIGHSKAAFDALFPKLDAALARGEEIWITVSGLPDPPSLQS